MAKKSNIRWRPEPEDHDYPAAESYLTLLFKHGTASAYAGRLRRARVVSFKAKDIFRASSLPLLGPDNFHVRRDREKIRSRERISPLLLVRTAGHETVVIADGYHRLCAVYSFDEDAVIPCKIVGP